MILVTARNLDEHVHQKQNANKDNFQTWILLYITCFKWFSKVFVALLWLCNKKNYPMWYNCSHLAYDLLMLAYVEFIIIRHESSKIWMKNGLFQHWKTLCFFLLAVQCSPMWERSFFFFFFSLSSFSLWGSGIRICWTRRVKMHPSCRRVVWDGVVLGYGC